MSLRDALQAAAARGLTLRPVLDQPGVVYAICSACGYGDGPGREVSVEKYARRAFSCPMCELEAA